MPIIIGVIFIFMVLWGGRLLLISNPILLATLLRGIIWATAIVGIAILVLSGRLINVIIGLLALIPLGASIQRHRRKIQEDHQPSSATPISHITKDQALQILDLKSHCTKREIKEAHRRLVKKVHPDQGGSDFLMAQVNQAKDVLLRES